MSQIYKHKKLGVAYHKPTGLVLEKKAGKWVAVGMIVEEKILPLNQAGVEQAKKYNFGIEKDEESSEESNEESGEDSKDPTVENFLKGFDQSALLYMENAHDEFTEWALPFSKIVKEHSGIDILEWKDAPDLVFVYSGCFCAYEKLCQNLGREGVFDQYRKKK